MDALAGNLLKNNACMTKENHPTHSHNVPESE